MLTAGKAPAQNVRKSRIMPAATALILTMASAGAAYGICPLMNEPAFLPHVALISKINILLLALTVACLIATAMTSLWLIITTLTDDPAPEQRPANSRIRRSAPVLVPTGLLALSILATWLSDGVLSPVDTRGEVSFFANETMALAFIATILAGWTIAAALTTLCRPQRTGSTGSEASPPVNPPG